MSRSEELMKRAVEESIRVIENRGMFGFSGRVFGEWEDPANKYISKWPLNNAVPVSVIWSSNADLPL